MEHLQRVWLANRGGSLLRTPCPVLFMACMCSNVEISLSLTCHLSCFRTLNVKHPSIVLLAGSLLLKVVNSQVNNLNHNKPGFAPALSRFKSYILNIIYHCART